MNSAYHEGEFFIQEQMGVRDKADALNSMIYKELPIVASQFIETLNFSVITFSKKNNELYTSVVSDINPYIKILSTKEIVIDLEKSSFIPKDIREEKDLDIGFLGLEFVNKMRIRINGKGKIKDKKLYLFINKVYSNCPKFINDRKIVGKINNINNPLLTTYSTLDKSSKTIIENADTFFISSSYKDNGADISHKGGNKGFLRILSSTHLEFDDFPGNNMFNTLGNIHKNSNINIMIIDFSNNDVLHINGTASILEEIQNKSKKLILSVHCTKISIESNSFVLKYNK